MADVTLGLAGGLIVRQPVFFMPANIAFIGDQSNLLCMVLDRL